MSFPQISLPKPLPANLSFVGGEGHEHSSSSVLLLDNKKTITRKKTGIEKRP